MYKQGDIWLVNFDPSVGREYQKVRPALVLENSSYIALGSLLTVVPISSQINKATLLDVLIARTIRNRLQFDSVVKTRQVSSFDKQRFIKKIGVCQIDVLETVLYNVILFLKKDD